MKPSAGDPAATQATAPVAVPGSVETGGSVAAPSLPDDIASAAAPPRLEMMAPAAAPAVFEANASAAAPNPVFPPPPPLMRWPTMLGLVLLLMLIVASFASLKLEWAALFTADAVRSMLEFLHGFAPPDMAAPFLRKVALAALETLAMSALGTLFAACAGLLLALPASGRFGRTARLATRLLLNFARAMPELVWASIMLIAAGLGPFAGTMALAAHTAGVLGRLFAEVLENAPPHAANTLRGNGAGIVPTFLYATLPQSLPQMLSYTLYRWENNIRAAAILGVVGAGGLGQMLKYHLSLFQMQSAASLTIAMLILVALVDACSFTLRRRLVG